MCELAEVTAQGWVSSLWNVTVDNVESLAITFHVRWKIRLSLMGERIQTLFRSFENVLYFPAFSHFSV